MPKTHSSKLAKASDAADQGQRYNPLIIPEKLRRWKKAARNLHQTSTTHYKEIKQYLSDCSDAMTTPEKETLADILSLF